MSPKFGLGSKEVPAAEVAKVCVGIKALSWDLLQISKSAEIKQLLALEVKGGQYIDHDEVAAL